MNADIKYRCLLCNEVFTGENTNDPDMAMLRAKHNDGHMGFTELLKLHHCRDGKGKGMAILIGAEYVESEAKKK